jgi:monoamine oxidase
MANGKILDRADVVIVGAGFAGLSAARALKDAGVGFVLLEAQDHVGGRVESRLNGLGERVDTGGQFLCEDMPELMALAKRHGRLLVETRFDGAPASQPPLAVKEIERSYAGSMAIRDRLNEVSPDDLALAGLTVADWLARQPHDADAKAGFRSMIEGLWCLALEVMPAWYLVSNDRRVTNTVGELQYFVAGTMHSLAEDLAGGLGHRVVLGAAVRRIEHGKDGVRVFASVAAPPPLTPPHKGEGNSGVAPRADSDDSERDGCVGVSLPPVGRGQGWGYAPAEKNRSDEPSVVAIDARAVLVCLPPATAAKLDFSPALPQPVREALDVWRSGAVIKLFLRYSNAFWRNKGLSGLVFWRDPAGLFAFDASPDDRHPMLGFFVGGPMALEVAGLGEAAVKAKTLEWLVAALGPEAAGPLDVLVRNWTNDRWSGGAYSDLVVDMRATDAEDVLRAGAPPLFFAASELSPSYPGYIEGAIVAGREGARQVLAALQSASATSASGS